MSNSIFQNIPEVIQKRMDYLIELDKKDRAESRSREKRLRQITPETGRFIAIMASLSPTGDIIEIGTSGGYSTLWLALACLATERKITTCELLLEKIAIAKETFISASVDDLVNVVEGDARQYLHRLNKISFCFLDAEKEIYLDCYKLVVDRMVSGGILVADNAISHQGELQQMLNYVENDSRVDSLVVPIGRGELLCRKNG